MPPSASPAPAAGRPYDRAADAVILSVTLDLLTESPYERVTLDDVAARTGRAKTTLYRRWPTKDDLILAAVRSIGRPPESDDLPDCGSLRADLLTVIDSPWLGGPARRLALFAGLASAGRSSRALADVVRSEVTDPYVGIYRSLLTRAVERGEVSPSLAPRIPLLADVIPALSSHRLNTSSASLDRAVFVAIVDDVLLPALRAPELGALEHP